MDNKDRNRTQVYQHGYIAGYTQHRVDIGEISREEADKIIRKSLV